MNIAGREIGPRHPPYIVAEVSCNHGGSLGRALELIKAAKDCGADAVKFQCMMAHAITIDCDRPEFMIEDGPWKGRNLYQLYKETETPYVWFNYIKKEAEKVGITWFASVFDPGSVEILEALDCPAYKIASFELVDIPLIKCAVATGKPIILSTGMATLQEVKDAVPRDMPLKNLALLHCVSGYPTPASEANLFRMHHLGNMFSTWGHDQVVGISDHGGPEIPIAATALGANIIEKHFRLRSHPDTEDSPFSCDEEQFAGMVLRIRRTWQAIQQPTGQSEQSSRPFRRSLFAVAPIKAGELFRTEHDLISQPNIRSIRPGHGLPPIDIYRIAGKVAARDIARGEPLSWDMIRDQT